MIHTVKRNKKVPRKCFESGIVLKVDFVFTNKFSCYNELKLIEKKEVRSTYVSISKKNPFNKEKGTDNKCGYDPYS